MDYDVNNDNVNNINANSRDKSNRNSIIENALAKHESIKVHINMKIMENGKNSYRIRGRNYCPEI